MIHGGCRGSRSDRARHSDSQIRGKHFLQYGSNNAGKNVSQLVARNAHFFELGEIIFQGPAELTSRPPVRQQVRIDCQLNQIGLLLRSLAELVVDDFQVILRMKSDRVHAGGNLDAPSADRQANSLDICFRERKDILPVLEVLASLLKVDKPPAITAQPLRE